MTQEKAKNGSVTDVLWLIMLLVGLPVIGHALLGWGGVFVGAAIGIVLLIRTVKKKNQAQ